MLDWLGLLKISTSLSIPSRFEFKSVSLSRSEVEEPATLWFESAEPLVIFEQDDDSFSEVADPKWNRTLDTRTQSEIIYPI